MVTPYFTQHRPPALVATLPPIEQISKDDGSGGYQSPCSAAASFTSWLNAPGSTTATWQSVSISMALHPLEAEDDAAVDGARPTGETAARTSGHDRNVMGRSPPDDGLHLAGILGTHHRERGAGVRGRATSRSGSPRRRPGR